MLHNKKNIMTKVILAMLIAAFSFLLPACTTLHWNFDKPDNENTAADGTGYTEGAEADESDFIGNLKLPAEKNVLWKEVQEGEIVRIRAEYEKVVFEEFLDFLRSLVQEGWYLHDNSAVNGNKNVEISYDTISENLLLYFEKDYGKPQWLDVLPDFLKYGAPVFTGAEYAGTETVECKDCNIAIALLYENADGQSVKNYTEEILSDGYTKNGRMLGGSCYTKGTVFIVIDHNFFQNKLRLTIGQFTAYYVPLPPWPDTLPEEIRRTLPPVGAACTAETLSDGYYVQATGISLSGLLGFFNSIEDQGWSALQKNGQAFQEDLDSTMYKITFISEEKLLSFCLTGGKTSLKTEEPGSQTETPGSWENGGGDETADYVYMVTAKSYSEKDAMDGITEEFGQDALMADWNEIKLLYGGTIADFLESAGVKRDEDIWVVYGGNEFDGNRHYYLSRIGGNPRENFYKYDEIGDEAWLGSWYGLELRVLVKTEG